MDPAKDLRGELAPALALQTGDAQLLEVTVKSLDDFIGVIEKKALLVSHCSSSLAQNECRTGL
jgi:hypothetical protein